MRDEAEIEEFEDEDEDPRELQRWLRTSTLSLDYIKVGRLVEWKLKGLLSELQREGCRISYTRQPGLAAVWYVNLSITGTFAQIDRFESTILNYAEESEADED